MILSAYCCEEKHQQYTIPTGLNAYRYRYLYMSIYQYINYCREYLGCLVLWLSAQVTVLEAVTG